MVQQPPSKRGMSAGQFVFGALWRVIAMAFVLLVAAVPLLMYLLRVHEGLYEDTIFWAAGLAAGLFVFPALIFLSWHDAAVGSIIPLIMLATILSMHELTDPDFAMVPKHALQGRTALIVSGNRGIGLGVAKEFLKRGANVIVTWRTKGNAAQEIQAYADATADGGKFLGGIDLDMASRDSVDSFAGRLRQRFGDDVRALHSVVINSGTGCAEGVDANGVETTLAVNVVGPVRLAHALLPLLASDSNATVIFSSSPSARGWFGTHEQLVQWHSELDHITPEQLRCFQKYARSKLLLDVATMELAQTRPHVRWYAVYPGPTHTDMFTNAFQRVADALYTPAIARTKIFGAYVDFWSRVLARPVESVALQYSFAAWPANTLLERNGCSFYADRCLAPLSKEREALAVGVLHKALR